MKVVLKSYQDGFLNRKTLIYHYLSIHGFYSTQHPGASSATQVGARWPIWLDFKLGWPLILSTNYRFIFMLCICLCVFFDWSQKESRHRSLTLFKSHEDESSPVAACWLLVRLFVRLFVRSLVWIMYGVVLTSQTQMSFRYSPLESVQLLLVNPCSPSRAAWPCSPSCQPRAEKWIH